MKILLRNCQTGFYCGPAEQWVSDVAAALDFKQLERAGEKAREYGSHELRIVLHYEQPPCELAIDPDYCV